MSDWLLPNKIQEAGYHPVFRVITQTNYNDTMLGNRMLIDTLPADVRLRTPICLRDEYEDISKSGIGTPVILNPAGLGKPTISVSSLLTSLTNVKDQVVTGLTGSGKTPDDRPLEGCLIDSSFQNPDYHWANVIFRNPIVSNPRGEELFGTDLLKIGFPIWIYIGYIDSSGNIVNHPFDPKPVPYLPLMFGGFVGSLLQEIKAEAGDRMILQCVGYKWYLKHFLFFADKGGTLTGSRNERIDVIINRMFAAFDKNGGQVMPSIIAKAMRLDLTNNCSPSVRYLYGASPAMHPLGQPSWEGANRTDFVIGKAGNNYRTILENIARTYDVDIEWDANGYLNVRGKLDPFMRMAEQPEGTDKVKLGSVGKGHETRIHDAILGGNVRDWSFVVDAEHIATGIRLRMKSPQSGEPFDTYMIDKWFMDDLARKEQTDPVSQSLMTIEEVLNEHKNRKRVDADDDAYSLFGTWKQKLVDVLYTTEKAETGDEKKISPWSEPSLKALAKRLKYWGLRGEAMLIGNAHIREGDLIRVTDMRDKTGILNINLNVAKEVLSSIGERITKERKKGGRGAALLGIKALENVFYIWKVRHYVGPTGYWTKIYFTPHREAFATQSEVMRDLQRQSGRSRDEVTQTR